MIIRKSRLSEYFLLLLFVGFFYVSFLPEILGIDNRFISVPFRAAILIFSFLIILIFNKVKKNIIVPLIPFLVFWTLYSARLFYDLFIADILFLSFDNRYEYLLYAFGVCFIPTFSLIFINFDNINFDKFLLLFYDFLFVAIICAIPSTFNSIGRSTGDLSVSVLLFGQFGASLSLLSFYRLFRKNNSNVRKAYLISGFFLGLFVIGVSGSRSPLFALLVVSLIYVFLRNGAFKLLLSILLLTLLVYLSFGYITSFLDENFNLTLISRILYSVEYQDSSGRDELLPNAINDFINNPFLGRAFLLQEGFGAGFYPHNLIIESFMALGFFGGLVFIIWNIQALYGSVILIKNRQNSAWISILFLQYFLFSMLSSSLYLNNYFWHFGLIVIILSKTLKNS